MFKVLIVAPGLSMGGAENASVNLANGMKKCNCEVVFVSLFKNVHFFHLSEGIRLYEPSNFNIKRLNFFKTLLWLRKIERTENPDAIIIFQKFYSAIGVLSLICTKYKIIISERSSPLFNWGLPINIFNRIVFTIKKPDGIIAQTSVAAKFQQKYYGSRVPIRIIPNIVREVKLYPEIEREKFILAVGRLNDYLKGFDRLIRAMAELKNDWPLYIAGGDGSEKEGFELKFLAKELGIENKIKFLGKVKEIDKLYARAGLFVIPSRSEGFPNALCEAMAAGCCCISFNFIAGPNEIIKNGINGFIIEDDNILKLAEMIDFLISNETIRKNIEKKATEVKEKYSEEVISKTVIDFINEIEKK